MSKVTCPRCSAKSTYVRDSRRSTHNTYRRRRECIVCNYRWTTFEITSRLWDEVSKMLKILYGEKIFEEL